MAIVICVDLFEHTAPSNLGIAFSPLVNKTPEQTKTDQRFIPA